ncbi:hypothetical protein [Actinomadura sp. 3N508]|uniref:hypothetical protein n=1 Tax=Actinomadura sp. 3N508 TaxID=3375153 RepID=UPI0037A51D93
MGTKAPSGARPDGCGIVAGQSSPGSLRRWAEDAHRGAGGIGTEGCPAGGTFAEPEDEDAADPARPPQAGAVVGRAALDGAGAPDEAGEGASLHLRSVHTPGFAPLTQWR